MSETDSQALQDPHARPPGDLAIWIFICAELLVFAVFFASYAFTRAAHVELFNEWQLTLNRDYALINTLALITSSYFVVRAIAAVREGRQQPALRWLLGALAMGALFLIVKSMEYAEHYSHGINLRSNLFFMFYFSLTFFHFMHVLMGMVILGVNAAILRRGGYTAENHRGMETGGSYWHMVDMLWLILFPLVYVMR